VDDETWGLGLAGRRSQLLSRALARPWQLAQGCLWPTANKKPPDGTPSSQARPLLSKARPHLESTAVMKAISREMHLRLSPLPGGVGRAPRGLGWAMWSV
jgi:hypothetical protein